MRKILFFGVSLVFATSVVCMEENKRRGGRKHRPSKRKSLEQSQGEGSSLPRVGKCKNLAGKLKTEKLKKPDKKSGFRRRSI